MISSDTRQLLEMADEPGVGVAALRRELESRLGKTSSDYFVKTVRTATQSGKRAKAHEIISKCEDLGISVLSTLDQQYPTALALIREYPPLLYVRGNLDILNQISVAVVGTRSASPLGASWARQIARALAEHEISVVSGLALGIDEAAHAGALEGGGPTVAILAHGLDVITPTPNVPLANEIIEAGGAVVSEHPPGVPPRRSEYVRRNRLQSGMSVCSMVIESGREGGAIHQARFTRSQGRELFTVVPAPGTPGSGAFNAEGSQFLTAEMGARAITKRADLQVLFDTEFFKSQQLRLIAAKPSQPQLL